MTAYQQYLAHDMSESDIQYCEKEAENLEKTLPWAEQDNTNTPEEFTCWLDVVMRTMANEIAFHRGMYCAEMGVD